jgi:MFS family permease
MVEYKWIALSNTAIGTLMATINGTIVLISLPAILRGISIDPLSSFQYLLWILFGYLLVTSVLLVSFGRISDMFGRVRLFNLGFVVFTLGVAPLCPHAQHRRPGSDGAHPVQGDPGRRRCLLAL